jgi:Protein of unknown function (DUF4031)
MKMCHMLADTEEEMHAMADKIGIQRKWYQGDHYDICMAKRDLALAAGAREVSSRYFPEVRRRLRWAKAAEEAAKFNRPTVREGQ